MRKKKFRITRKAVISLIPAAFFLLFVLFVSIRTYSLTIRMQLEQTNLSMDSFESLTDSFEQTLQENFFQKNSFINLNGLTTRVLGINSLNDRMKLANGHLSYFESAADISEEAADIIGLDQFLNNRGIGFLYMLAPCKDAFYDISFSPGYGSDRKLTFDDMTQRLNDANVNNISMNQWFEANQWTMDDVYFKTDHHWQPQAALAAADATMQLLTDKGIIDSYNKTLLSKDSYTIITLNNWYLGSHGKRVGKYYAGLDDIDAYIPNFLTQYHYSYLRRYSTVWTYTDTVLDSQYLNSSDYFNDDPYAMYMFGDFPNRITINDAAPINSRVLLMGDSYKLPYEYFLSTQFREIYTLDFRYWSDGATFAEYVEEVNPDIVIMCLNSVSDLTFYQFGVQDYQEKLKQTDPNAAIQSLGDCSVTADEANSNCFSVICTNLEPGKTYTLTVDSSSYSGGNDQYVQMELKNLESNESDANRYFDANSNDTQRWIFTVPDTSSTYAINLYAGTNGHTQNGSLKMTNICLQEGIHEG